MRLRCQVVDLIGLDGAAVGDAEDACGSAGGTAVFSRAVVWQVIWHPRDERHQRVEIQQVAVVEVEVLGVGVVCAGKQGSLFFMLGAGQEKQRGILRTCLQDVLQARMVVGRRPALHAVDHIAFGQQQLCIPTGSGDIMVEPISAVQPASDESAADLTDRSHPGPSRP